MTSWLNRSTAMFLLGAGGFIYELTRSGAERPLILALIGALMGLPFFLNTDLKRQPPPPEDDDRGDRWSHLP